MDDVDTIVVGAGVGGCVAARRLADGGRRVLLIERGRHRPPNLLTGIDATAVFDEADWFAPDSTADLGPGRSPIDYRRGVGVGGGSAVNTLVLTAGDRADYDRWADEFGCPGWGWSEAAEGFGRAVAALMPTVVEPGPLARAIEPVAVRAGHDTGAESAQSDASGFLRASLAIADGRRRSAADAYLSGRPSGPSVHPNTSVRRVMRDGTRVIGVELADRSIVRAPEVIVAGGAIATPRLLARSGIGSADAPVVVEDHPSFVLTVGLRAEHRHPVDEARAPISTLVRWSSQRDVAGSSGSGVDLMALIMDHVGPGITGRRYGAVIVVLTDVDSRGEITADRFSPGWLRAASDRRRLVAGVRHWCRLLSDPALDAAIDGVFIDDVGTPASALDAMTDDRMAEWLLDHPGPVAHPASTCRPGTGLGGVLDLDGSVRGVSGLRVADASVLPHLPNANPQLPVMAVAERLAAEWLGER